MKKILSLILLTALIACSVPTPTPSAALKPLGMATVTVDATPIQQGKLRTQAILPDMSLMLTTTFAGMVDNPQKRERWIFNTFEFTNSGTATIDNLNFYAIAKSSNFAGTAISRMEYSNGSSLSDVNLARSIKPVQGFTSNGASLDVSATTSNFQALSSFDSSNRELTAKNAGFLTGTDAMLDYGFIANNTTDGKRRIAPGANGRVTFAAKIPYGTLSEFSLPTRLTFTMLMMTEGSTWVTKSLEETAPAAQARATALGVASFTEIGTGSATITGARVVNPRTSIEGVNYINTNFPSGAIAALRTNSTPNGTAVGLTLEAINPDGSVTWERPIRTARTGPNYEVVQAGLNPEEGLLTRSTNKKCLVFTGYTGSVGSAVINASSATTNPRVIGVAYADGAINTRTTTGTAYDGQLIGGAASANCTNIYTTGGDPQSLRNQFINNSTSLAVAGDGARTQSVKIVNNSLYTTLTNSTTNRFANIPFLPTGGIITLQNMIFNTNEFPTDFEFADLNAQIYGMDTLYVIESGKILKLFLDEAGVWQRLDYYTDCGTTLKALSLVQSTATTATLAVVQNSQIRTLTDLGGYRAPIVGFCNLLRTTGTGVYLGVAPAPQ